MFTIPMLSYLKIEQKLALFLYFENRIWGTNTFYHIPSNLFGGTGVHEGQEQEEKTLKLKDSTQSSESNFVYCLQIHFICTICGLQSCQYSWAVTVCGYEEDPGSGGGGGGGTGGGGGGTGGGGGCYAPFYLNFVDPCDDPPTTPPLTPCQKAYQACQIVTDLFRRAEMQSRKAEMTANFLPNREKAFWFGKANLNDPNYTTTNVILGDTGISITVTPFPPSSLGQLAITNGAAHAHTTESFRTPSAGDMYNYAWVNSQNPNFKYFIFSPGQSDYTFVNSDSIFLRNFALNWLPTIYLDSATGDWKQNTEIFEKSDDVYTYFKTTGKTEDEAMELAQAFIAYKYQTGITIAKMDAQGVFKPIFVKEIPDPLDPTKKIYVQTSVCNLNTIIVE